MKVILLSNTPDPERLIATAARLCYSNKVDIETIENGFTEEEIENFIDQLINSGHLSPLEHVSLTFGIEDISRTVSHELVRHRIGIAISQRSQRYCVEKECDFVIPREIQLDSNSRPIFEESLKDSKSKYHTLINNGVKKEIARYLLPNATKTRMIVTMNARELLHFLNLRCCMKAQPEMRDLAYLMLALANTVIPTVIKHAGPSCDTLGYCPEGNRCCGRAPTLQQLKDSFTGKNSK